jgi:hypothetical protein
MELRHLRYFIAAAEEGSVTLAAERRLRPGTGPSQGEHLSASQAVSLKDGRPDRSRVEKVWSAGSRPTCREVSKALKVRRRSRTAPQTRSYLY